MTPDKQLKNCLLITPKSFYSFSTYLKDALSLLNYDTVVVNDEYPENTIGKIMGKLHIPLLLTITEKVVSKNYLNGHKYDLVLIIKGRGINKLLLEKLKIASPKVVAYNFDSFKYHKAPLKWYKYVTKYCTFDYRDADEYALPVVELFSSINSTANKTNIQYSISAIVRNHSNRLKYINNILKLLKEEKIFIFVYEKNVFTFCINFFKSPFLYLKYRKYISFKPLPYNNYMDVLEKSNFTIDCAHPKQTGITIRCFEALSTQTKIITNNPFVNRNSNFNDTNTIIFHENREESKFIQQYNKIFNVVPLKYHRSISDFLNQLIS